ncbi:hypothetical protein QQF64_011606 [Cirrhinus molitorella]|uniref:G-protein coupled receptors family 1 profile domain-containing protein n=1 Tax=Cirrhinus molitorella TaxID=172907 RepID=A0ABR3LZR1_9TELE
MEFLLISVPLDKASCQSLEKLKRVSGKTGLVTSSRFHIPELKVGTLDVLLGVSDDLSRLDSYTEGVMRQTSQCLGEVMEEFSGKLLESMLANGEHKTHQKDRQSPLKSYFQTIQVDLATYVTRFQWDRAKYPTAQPLKTLADIISKQVSQVDTELKSRRAAYSHVKATIQSFERKTEGSLQTRALTNIVKREDLVLNSEYLTTLLVVVPRMAYALWEKTYESMSKFVVPRSSRKLVEDADAGIFTVTLFKNVIAEFKANAKKHKFTVREYNLDEAEKQKQEIGRLAVDKKELYRTFVCWLKVNFSEIFVAWIHIKVLRTFVESILRYGLPVSFQAILLQPSKKSMKQLRQQLNSLFKHLDPAAATSKPDVSHTVMHDYNDTDDIFDYEYDYEEEPCNLTWINEQQVLVPTFIYSLTCSLGLVGNVLVLLTYAFYKKAKTMTDIYLVNVALADLLFVVALPLIIYNEQHDWSMGTWACKFLRAAYSINVYSSTLLLACISGDRYIAIVQARRSVRIRLQAQVYSRLICLVVWLLAFFVSLPTFIYYQVENKECITNFEEYNTAKLMKILIPSMQMVLGFLVPLTVMIFCYSCTMVTLLKAQNFQKHKAIRVVLVVVFVFVLCHLPYNVVLLINTSKLFNERRCEEEQVTLRTLSISRSVAYLHCCLNPILYAFIGVKFRGHFCQIFRDLRCLGKRYISGRSSQQTSELYVSANKTVAGQNHENLSSFSI